MGVILFNFGDEDFQVAIGDRIAQFILERIHIPVLIEHDEKLDDTVRGEAGFGSTGVSVWKWHFVKLAFSSMNIDWIAFWF